jgi:hypothetical protein
MVVLPTAGAPIKVTFTILLISELKITDHDLK